MFGKTDGYMHRVLGLIFGFILAPMGVSAASEYLVLDAQSPQMVQATTLANESLDDALAAAKFNPETYTDLMLKVGFPILSDVSPSTIESVWVIHVRTDGSNFSATLDSAPIARTDITSGKPVTFTRDQIQDWGLTVEGRAYGFFSTRAMLPMLEASSQKAFLQSTLSEAPLPQGW